MKYYAVTEDPRELYHYGVLGMKWGQHIFGDKPKSPAYKNAVKKLKAAKTSAVSSAAKVAKTVKVAVPKVKKTAAQAAYNIRAKQQNRFEKSIAKAQARLDKSNIKFDNYQADVARKSVEKQINKAAKAVKRQENSAARKEKFNNAIATVQRTANQIAQTKRNLEQQHYNKAVEKAQKRNNLFDAFRDLDKENKLYKQAERERKMDSLREKQSEVMADNDLKSMEKAVRVEKHMPKYYQQARTGMLSYGKLSDEQIGRLQGRLALEAQTRRLGSTEAPSWRQQKKAARREGYLQGITRGVSAGMEEVGRASVQYGLKSLANRKKLDSASEHKAEREKTANRIKNKKTHREIDKDIKQQTYEQRALEGENIFRRNNPLLSTARQAKRLNAIKDTNEERKFLKDEARKNISEENKFLREENQATHREERQNIQRLTEQDIKADRIGESIHKYGVAAIPIINKDGKQTGTKLIDEHDNDGASYLKLYRSRHKEEATAYDREQKAARDRQTQIERAAKEREAAEKAAAQKAAEDRAKKDAAEKQRLEEMQRQSKAKSDWAAEIDAAQRKKDQEEAIRSYAERQQLKNRVRTRRLPNDSVAQAAQRSQEELDSRMERAVRMQTSSPIYQEGRYRFNSDEYFGARGGVKKKKGHK